MSEAIETAQSDWLRGVDLNHRPLGYEPNELPDCSTPQFDFNNRLGSGQTSEKPSIYAVFVVLQRISACLPTLC
jgi:hypothetical protein